MVTLTDFCRERSEVTLHFRPFTFNCILMLLIRLHGEFSRPFRRRRRGWEGKITSRRIFISRFRFHRMEASSAKRMYFECHDHAFIAEFYTANVSLAVKVRLPRLKEKTRNT